MELEPSSVVQIGCGIVGHAYGLAFSKAGHRVIGIEASDKRIAEIRDCYEMHHVREDLSILKDIDFILLSINTPLDPIAQKLNMKYIWSSLKNVSAILRTNPTALVVVRSTVTIGFCAAYKDALEKETGLKVRLCFQPEFLRAKSAVEDAMSPWQIVLGCENSTEIADYYRFQQGFIDKARITFCTIDEAEIMKIFHNSYNAMNISYFNQANLLVQEIVKREGKNIDAEKTFKIIGKTCEGLLNANYGLTPGHAYYGTCLPKDSAELANMEKKYGLDCNIFRAVVDVNNEVKKTDKQEVLYGDNHMDKSVFHKALGTKGPKKPAKDVIEGDSSAGTSENGSPVKSL